MKKILFPFMALALTFASCDMDKEPYDSLPDGAITSPQEFEGLSNGLYSGLRSCVYSTSFSNAPDIQGDEFNAISGYSNALSYMYMWTFNSNASEIDNVYANCHGLISRSNYIIDRYNTCDMSNPNVFDKDGIAKVKNIKGEAFFVRAWALSELAKFFCQDYEETIADEENSGVSYQIKYNPSMDESTYPARNTLRQTYKQITDDLDSAEVYITKGGEADSKYITADVVNALRARVALAMDDYTTAAQIASALADKSTYTLAKGLSDIRNMWWGHEGNGRTINDTDKESLLRIYTEYPSEVASQTGKEFQPYMKGGIPDYVPTKDVIDLYAANDMRTQVYFTNADVTSSAGTSGKIKVLNKYREKGAVYYSSSPSEYSRWMVMPKVFRIAEMYLIAAEAYAKLGNITEGAKYLNKFETSRIRNYKSQTFANADELMNEVKKERQREFIGEGVRFFDLKRWHQKISRGIPQQMNLCNLPGYSTTTGLNINYGDVRYVWPIPQHEIDANPQIVQNPGY